MIMKPLEIDSNFTGLYVPGDALESLDTLRFAFCFTAGTSALPPEISFEDSWTKGHYAFFAPGAVSDWKYFGALVNRAFGPNGQAVGAAFGWFDQLNFFDGIPGTFRARKSGKIYATNGSFQHRMRNLTIFIGAGAVVAPTSTGFVFAKSGNSSLTQRYYKVGQSKVVESDIGPEVELIAFGEDQGKFRFPLVVSPQDLTVMEAGIQYYQLGNPQTGALDVCPGALIEHGGGAGGALTLDATLDFEVWDNTTYKFSADLIRTTLRTELGHPVYLKNAGSAEFRLANRPTEMFFRQRELHVDARHFCFAPEGEFEILIQKPTESRQTVPYNLILGTQGTEYIRFKPRFFALTVNGIRRLAGAGDRLAFRRGQPALRAVDNKTSEGRPVVSNLLIDARSANSGALAGAVTSWVSVQATNDSGAKAAYLAQPEEGAMFADAGGAQAEPPLLDFQELPLREYGAGGAPATIFFPILPFGGREYTASGLKVAIDVESNAVSAARKWLLVEGPDSRIQKPSWAAKSSFTAVTPQGFRIVVTDQQLDKVTFARISGQDRFTFDLDTGAAKTTDDSTISITNLGPEIQDALQQSQICIVATRHGNGQNQFDFADQNDILRIAGWPMHLSPSAETQPSEFDPGSPILVFKFYKQTLAELLADPGTWSYAGLFNKNVNDVKVRAASLIETARNSYAKDPQSSVYRYFVENVLDNPDWNGVIALNSVVDLSTLPTQIKGVTGGMEADTFRAHHAGVSVNKVSAQGGGVLEIDKSSLFALIDYIDPVVAAGKDPYKEERGGKPYVRENNGYSFFVPNLQVLFFNSEIQHFDCKVELGVGTLFSDVARRTDQRPFSIEELDALETARKGAIPGNNIVRIVGTYQANAAVDAEGNAADVYSFVHKENYTFALGASGDNPILESVEINKFEFVTEAADDTSAKSRFLCWGKLKFQKLEFPLFSFEALVFEGLGITLAFKIKDPDSDFRMGFAPGNLSFDASLSKSAKDTFFKQFPLKLNGFKFALDAAIAKLPSLSTFNFHPVSFPSLGDDYVVSDGHKFQYGLVFEMDCGSLGALVPAFKEFKIEFLLGWIKKNNVGKHQAAFGVRLGKVAGKLEIGIQGVLKLIIENFMINWSDKNGGPMALVMNGSRLEILGAAIPDSDGFDVTLLVPGESSRELGWFASKKDIGSVAGLDITYMGFGQRIGRGKGFTTTKDAIDWMKKGLHDAVDKKEYEAIYRPDDGWLFGLEFDAFSSAVKSRMVFSDPTFYALYVNIVKFIIVEIGYRKITDDIGVYFTDVGLPEELRQFEAGVASVTTPMIGISCYTNRDWKLDGGFPDHYDFSRSARCQLFPFTGSGGFYLAELSAETTSLFDRNTYKNITEIGFALRIGLGKDISKGIFKAGASLTVFGILEGAIGFNAIFGSKTPAAMMKSPDGYVLQGQVGIIGEIYGYVNFGIVMAGVHARAWAAIGMRIVTNKPTVIFVEMGISVGVTIVIGRIKIFGRNIEIRVSYSFQTVYRDSWTLGKSGSGLIYSDDGVAPLPPIPWGKVFATFPKQANAPERLDLIFAPEVTVVPNGAGGVAPQIIANLLIKHAAGHEAATQPFDRLCAKILEMVFDSRGIGGTTDVTVQRIDEILKSIESKDPFAWGDPKLAGKKAAWQESRLDHRTIAKWLSNNFVIHISAPADRSSGDTAAHATLFPMFPELTLKTPGHPDRLGDVDFKTKNLASDAYQKALHTYFTDMMMLIRQGQDGASILQLDTKSVATIIFQDYFEFLIKAALRHAQEPLISAGKDSLPRDELIAAITNFEPVAGMASKIFRHGLRIPELPTQPPGEKPLYHMSGQQFPAGNPAADYDVTLETTNPLGWLSVAPDARQTVDQKVVQELRALNLGEPEITTYPIKLFDYGPQNFSFERVVAWHRGEQKTQKQPIIWSEDDARAEAIKVDSRWTLLPFGDDLLKTCLTADRRERSSVELRIKRSGVEYERDKDADRLSSEEFDWGTRIPLTVRGIPKGAAAKLDGNGDQQEFLENTYQLGGTSGRSWELLDRVLKLLSAENAPKAALYLLYDKKAGEPGQGVRRVSEQIDRNAIHLIRTNLSTISAPPPANILTPNALVEEVSPAATLAETRPFLELVKKCSTINGPGYYLYYPGEGKKGFEFADNLVGNAAHNIDLLIVFEDAAWDRSVLEPGFNTAVVKRTPPERNEDKVGTMYFVRTENIQRRDLAQAAGAIGFRALMANPEFGHDLTKVTDLEGRVPRDAHGLSYAHAKGILKDLGLSETKIEKYLDQAGAQTVAMQKLYTMLSFTVKGNSDFAAEEKTLPVGPEPRWLPEGTTIDRYISGNADLASDHIDELLEEAPAGADELEPDIFLFKTAIPIYKKANTVDPNGHSKIGVACPDIVGTVGSKTDFYQDNPYDGTGGTGKLELKLRDVFGNEATWSKNIDRKLLYFDDLLAPAEWPGLILDYTILPPAVTSAKGNVGKKKPAAKSQRAPGIAVHARVDYEFLKKLKPPTEQTQEAFDESPLVSALEYYDRVIRQLNAPGSEVIFESTLQFDSSGKQGTYGPFKTYKVPDADWANGVGLLQLATAIRAYLIKCLVGQNPQFGHKDSNVKILLQGIAGQKHPYRLFELKLWLGVQRSPGLVDSQAKPQGSEPWSAAQKAISELPAHDLAAKKESPITASPKAANASDSDLINFASLFRDAFAPCNFVLAQGVGIGRNGNLIVVDAFLTDIKIGARANDGRPIYFAPKPVLNELWTGYARVRTNPESPDETVQKKFASMDTDQALNDVFETFDRILMPDSALHIRRLAPSQYADLMRLKSSLAKGFAQHQLTYLANQQGNAKLGSIESAQGNFRERMLVELSQGYAIDAVNQYEVGWKPIPKSARIEDLSGKMSLFGNVRSKRVITALPVPDGDPQNPEQRVQVPAKVKMFESLRASGNDLRLTAAKTAPSSLLDFVFDAVPDTKIDQGTAEFTLEYEITHIEYEIGSVATAAVLTGTISDDESLALHRAEQPAGTAWLQLILPKSVTIGSDSTSRTFVPVPYRRYPTPATMIGHSWARGSKPGQFRKRKQVKLLAENAVSRARRWHYAYEFQLRELMPQDTIRTVVEYNNSPNTRPQANTSAQNLYQTVAAFNATWDVISSKLTPEKLKNAVDTGAGPESDTVGALKLLVATVSDLNGNTTWAAHLVGQAYIDKIEDSYKLREESASTPQHPERRRLVLDSMQRTGHFSARPVLLGPLKADGMPCEDIGAQVNGENGASVEFTPAVGEGDLGGWTRRRLTVSNLDVISIENAWGSVQWRRNENLLERVTGDLTVNEEFIYSTAPAKFPEAITPFILADEPIDIAALPQPDTSGTLQSRLVAMLHALFKANRRTFANDVSRKKGAPLDQDMNRLIKVECRYGFMLVDKVAATPNGVDDDVPARDLDIRHPIFMSPTFDFTIPSDMKDVDLGGVAAALSRHCHDRWLKKRDLNEDAFLNFDISIFGQLSKSDKPVLQLRNLRIKIGDLADA